MPSSEGAVTLPTASRNDGHDRHSVNTPDGRSRAHCLPYSLLVHNRRPSRFASTIGPVEPGLLDDLLLLNVLSALP